MPGHKGFDFFARNGFGEEIKSLADWDVTEIRGADNLFQPEDALLGVMEKYRELYDVRRSYLLINGSSAGIIASVLASVPRGGLLIMARNCHKSAFNALRLGNIEPVYAFPRAEEEFGVLGEITAEEIAKRMDENPDAKTVLIPSPNYYGICSDIEDIAREVHSRGGVLIVDQAHGAHLKFLAGSFEEISEGSGLRFPRAAEEQGADIVINSTHKTLASFTQTAVLNICGEGIDTDAIEDRLQMLESSSPSYPLMATLDMNADILKLKSKELMRGWAENIRWFYEKAAGIKGLSLMRAERMDMTKLNIDMSRYSLGGFPVDGAELERFLIKRGIFPELVSGDLVMCMTGIGNTRDDYRRLLEALEELVKLAELTEPAELPELSETAGVAGDAGPAEPPRSSAAGRSDKRRRPAPFTAALRRERLPEKKEKVLLSEASGRVCAMSVIPYPPGIPIACPGEVISREIIDYVISQREAGEKVIGVDENMMIWVGCE